MNQLEVDHTPLVRSPLMQMLNINSTFYLLMISSSHPVRHQTRSVATLSLIECTT